MSDPNLLIVDDDRALGETLRKSLGLEGYRTEVVLTGADALAAVEADPFGFDMALIDLRLPDTDGLDLLTAVRERCPDLECLVLTAHGSVQNAVEAMRRGALDFLTKPFPREKLLASVERGLERSRLVRENRLLRDQLRREHSADEVVGRSPRFVEALELLRSVAPTDATVLLMGETGTGKEHAARLVHRWSRRGEGPFLSVNCAALAETLLESQLFGHRKGSFSGATEARKGLFEEAEGGTLFLDEVGDISPSLQAKLLRVLEEKEFLPVGATRPRRTDARIVAATNRDLNDEVAHGRFREDLFYRLNLFTVVLPPLRRRLDDLELLAQGFVQDANRRVGKQVRGLDPEAVDRLRRHPWPGNVRELRNVVERAVILCQGRWLTVDLLALGDDGGGGDGAEGGFRWPAADLPLWEIEGAYVAEILRRQGWHKSASARILGIGRKTLDRKIKEFGLARPEDEG